MSETLGSKIGRLRTTNGWTQQELADRIAVSRVAISHFEMDLQTPSERTVALLAGVFKLEPDELVAGTYYPPAKAERLPPLVARYTEIEKELCLLERDFQWIERLQRLSPPRNLVCTVLHGWLDQLIRMLDDAPDRRTRQQLQAAQSRVQRAIRELRIGN